MQFPSEETGPITGRGIVGSHHQGGRLAEDLRLNHPSRVQSGKAFADKPDSTIVREYARERGVSTRWMWDQRNQLFSSVSRKFLAVLTSHLDCEEKASRIAELYRSEVKKNAIHLRVQTYEDIFECLLATPPKQVKDVDVVLRRNVHTDLLFDMYHFMKAGFSAPSPKLLEYLMFSVSYSTRTSPHLSPELMESRAHKLWLDADRYTLTPSRFTYTYYFEVCARRNIMHIALSRYIDAKERLGIQPDEAMCTSIIRGFVRNDQVEEAIGFISTMYAVPVDCFLLDAVIECFANSTDPLAAFSVYRSQTDRSGIHPTPFTFHYLMKACEKSGEYGETVYVLRQMLERGVQGTPATLNLILKGLLTLNKSALAEKLYLRMRRKETPVWDQLKDRIPEQLHNKGDEAHNFAVAVKENREGATSNFEAHYRHLTQWKTGETFSPKIDSQPVPVAVDINGHITAEFPLTPMSEDHLREFVLLGRTKWVDMEYLCQFLIDHKAPVVTVKNSKGKAKELTSKKLARRCRLSPSLKRKVYRSVRDHFFPSEKANGPRRTVADADETSGESVRAHKISVLGIDRP